MSQTIHIPKGMGPIDVLAITSDRKGAGMERKEVYRLHAETVQQVGRETILRMVSFDTPDLLRDVWSGRVVLPPIEKKVYVDSPIWGDEIALHNVATPEAYSGNMGYILHARDLSIMLCRMVGVITRELPDQRGVGSRFVSGWRKTLYLMRLCEDERFLRQFRGEDGLDVFAERYFSGRRHIARMVAANFLPVEDFDSLRWHSAVTQGARMQAASEIYESLLPYARELHAKRRRMGVNSFVTRLINRKREWLPDGSMLSREDPMKRFQKVREKLLRGGVDITELDDIIAQHGFGHREMQELYEEFVALAEEEDCNADELSQIFVDRGLKYRPLRNAFTKTGRKLLLDVFRKYGIKTKRLEEALVQNAFPSVVLKIIGWGYTPEPRKDLMRYLWIHPDVQGVYSEWLDDKFHDPQYEGPMYDQARSLLMQHRAQVVQREAEQWRRARRRAPKPKIVIQDGAAPERSRPSLDSSEVTPQDVFTELSSADGIPDAVRDRMDDALEAADEIDGPLTPTHINNLRKPFDQHLGVDVVDAALKGAGIKIKKD